MEINEFIKELEYLKNEIMQSGNPNRCDGKLYVTISAEDEKGNMTKYISPWESKVRLLCTIQENSERGEKKCFIDIRGIERSKGD